MRAASPRPGADEMFDLSRLSLVELIRCGQGLRALGDGATDVGDVSRRIATFLAEQVVDAIGARACDHVCVGRLSEATRQLEILGVDGDQSPAPEVVRAAFGEFGAHFGRPLDEGTSLGGLLGDQDDDRFNVWVVPDAAEIEGVPTDAASLVLFGGKLPSGDLVGTLMITRVPVPEEGASAFRVLALSALLAVLPFDGGGDVSRPEVQIARLSARIEALERLLEARDAVVGAQAESLEAVVGELALVRDAAQAIAGVATIDQALEVAVRRMCQWKGWLFGQYWVLDVRQKRLTCGERWYSSGARLDAFRTASVQTTFAVGEGVIGSVWESGQPTLVRDVRAQPGYLRTGAAISVGLSTCIVVPLPAGRGGVVVEFFLPPAGDHQTDLAFATTIAAQLRSFLAQKEAEEALADAVRELDEQARELRRSNAALEEFASVASHDLQEPLRMVSSFLELLERRYRDGLDDEAQEFIDYAVDGARRMQLLISDLLAYSRLGRPPEVAERVALVDTVGDAVELLRSAIEEADAVVQYSDLPVVRGERARLVQLFQNLIANAIKYRSEAPPRIRIESQREADAWTFRVSDNGVGIAPRHRDRVFGVFQRLHSDRAIPGTGIGLAICRRIVQSHGGSIWLEEQPPGTGATFAFSLPADDDWGAA